MESNIPKRTKPIIWPKMKGLEFCLSKNSLPAWFRRVCLILIIVFTTTTLTAQQIELTSIGQWPEYPRGQGQDIFVTETNLYVAMGGGGLAIFDTTNPTNLAQISNHPTTNNCRSVYVTNNLAYLACNSYVEILDITNPTTPRSVSKLPFSYPDAQGITVWGNLAYVANGRFGLYLLDIHNPQMPLLIGGAASITNAANVSIQGRKLCVIGSNWKINLLDIQEPHAPTLQHSYLPPDARIYDAAASGDYIFLGQSSHAALSIRNIHSFNEVTNYQIISGIRKIRIVGNLAYIAREAKGLVILDISQPESPQFVSEYQLSEIPYEMEVYGDHVYILQGNSGILVLDVSTPATPRLLEQKGIHGSLGEFQLESGIAYLADKVGLRILELSEPTFNIAQLGEVFTGGQALSLHVTNNLAYVADGQWGVHILDVSTPNNPTKISTFNTPGDATDVQVVDRLAYVAATYDGFRIYDVSNPSNPQLIGQTEPHGCQQIAVTGNHAYVVGSQYFSILDISNPSTIQLIGQYRSSGIVNTFRIVESLAYIGSDIGMEIIDLSNPTNLVRVGEYRTGSVTSVDVSGRYAFMTRLTKGILILDISQPERPVWAGEKNTIAEHLLIKEYRLYVSERNRGIHVFSWEEVDGTPPEILQNPIPRAVLLGTNATFSLAAQGREPITYRWERNGQAVDGANGNTLTITNAQTINAGDYRGFAINEFGETGSSEARLEVISISSDRMVTNTVRNSFPQGRPTLVSVTNNYAYIASSSGVLVANVENPEQPYLTGYATNTASYRDITVVASNLYLAAGSDGLFIFDISNPANPKRVGVFDTPGTAERLQVRDNIAYVADITGGLQIIDVSQPSIPKRLAAYGLGYTDIELRGSVAYLASDFNVIEIIDISTPSKPALLGRPPQQATWPTDIRIHENHAFVYSTRNRTLSILNVASPTTPSLVKSLSLSDNVDDIEIKGNLAYFSSKQGVLHVFDLTDPANPILQTTYDNMPAASMALAGDFMYTVDWISDLHIFSFSEASELLKSGTLSVGGLAYEISAHNGRIYLANELAGLEIWDHDPQSGLSRIGSYGKDFPGGIQHFAATSNLTFLVKERELQCLDFTVPDQPDLLDTFELEQKPFRMATSGRHLYLVQEEDSDRSAEILAFDVSDPTQLTLLSRLQIPYAYPLSDFKIKNNFLYITTSFAALNGDGLSIVDVTAPINMQLIKQANLVPFKKADKIAIKGNHLYMISGGTLLISDMEKNPSVPIGTFVLPSPFSPKIIDSLTLVNDFAYIGTRGNGWLIVYVGIPESPIVVQSFPSDRYVRDIKVHGDFIYLACDKWGLEVYRIGAEESAPLTIPSFSLSPDQLFRLNLQGGRGMIYLEASTNLVDWLPITNQPASNTPTELIDPESVLHPNRFYRLREGE